MTLAENQEISISDNSDGQNIPADDEDSVNMPHKRPPFYSSK